jgi:hypothetical protein
MKESTVKIKTSELSGAALDWAAKAASLQGSDTKDRVKQALLLPDNFDGKHKSPSTDWSQGGPIIEREGIELLCNLTETEAARFKVAHADWQAYYRQKRSTEQRKHGRTPLIAAMRCFVASKLGDEVDVPEELL